MTLHELLKLHGVEQCGRMTVNDRGGAMKQKAFMTHFKVLIFSQDN